MLNKYLLSTALVSSVLMSASASYGAVTMLGSSSLNDSNDTYISDIDTHNEVLEEKMGELPTVLPSNEVNQGMLKISTESADLTSIIWGGFTVETELNLDVTHYAGIVLTDLPDVAEPITIEIFSEENVFAYAIDAPLVSNTEFSILFENMIGFDNPNFDKMDIDQIKLTFNPSNTPISIQNDTEVPEPTTVLGLITVGGLGFLFRRR